MTGSKLMRSRVCVTLAKRSSVRVEGIVRPLSKSATTACVVPVHLDLRLEHVQRDRTNVAVKMGCWGACRPPYRATKLLEIGAGTSEIRRLIIAGELLRERKNAAGCDTSSWWFLDAPSVFLPLAEYGRFGARAQRGPHRVQRRGAQRGSPEPMTTD